MARIAQSPDTTPVTGTRDTRGTGLALHRRSIPGLLLVDLTVHRDARGSFKESFQREALQVGGFPDFEIVQHNIAYNAEAGVTRGIHAEPWDKYISLAQGRIFAAIVDLRDGPGFGMVETFEIGVDQALFVPKGCGNSYQTLTPDVVYSYLVNEHWSPEARYVFVNAYDPVLGIGWPVPEDDAIRSERDRAHPPMAALR